MIEEAAAVVQEAALEAAAVVEEAAAMEAAAVELAAAVVELAAVEAGAAVEIRSKSPEKVARAKPVVRSKSPDFKLQEQGGQLEQGKQGQRENNPQVLQSALCSCCC